MRNNGNTPFLKWPGGKRWLIQKYRDFFPTNFKTYIEPFVGSGAVFFSLHPSHAVVSDINDELINLYIVMKDRPQELRDILICHQKKHSKDYYYKMREKKYEDSLARAGRMLYLNRTCFNGMYRVNTKGVFNVPIGTKSNILFDIDEFNHYAELMKDTTIMCCDYSDTINKARSGDLVFVDPPYASKQNDNFIKYNDELFKWEDQLILHDLLVDAKDRGAFIMLTNVYNVEIINMYRKDGFFVHIVSRASTIASNAKKRCKVKELMIMSYRKPKKRKKKNEQNSNFK